MRGASLELFAVYVSGEKGANRSEHSKKAFSEQSLLPDQRKHLATKCQLPSANCWLQCRVRRLIVNADDFGLTAGVNRGIVEAHAAGIVTSTTLMANSTAFDDAVQLARSSPTLSVGCHLVLIDGSPLLGRDKVPSLMDPRNPGCFYQNISSFAQRALTGRFDANEIE